MKAKSRGLERLPGFCFEKENIFLRPLATFASLKGDLWNLRQVRFIGANYANQTTACVRAQGSPEGELR